VLLIHKNSGLGKCISLSSCKCLSCRACRYLRSRDQHCYIGISLDPHTSPARSELFVDATHTAPCALLPSTYRTNSSSPSDRWENSLFRMSQSTPQEQQSITPAPETASRPARSKNGCNACRLVSHLFVLERDRLQSAMTNC
jgi:hypothetical protein